MLWYLLLVGIGAVVVLQDWRQTRIGLRYNARQQERHRVRLHTGSEPVRLARVSITPELVASIADQDIEATRQLDGSTFDSDDLTLSDPDGAKVWIPAGTPIRLGLLELWHVQMRPSGDATTEALGEPVAHDILLPADTTLWIVDADIVVGEGSGYRGRPGVLADKPEPYVLTFAGPPTNLSHVHRTRWPLALLAAAAVGHMYEADVVFWIALAAAVAGVALQATRVAEDAWLNERLV